jgi:hypothetical protein
MPTVGGNHPLDDQELDGKSSRGSGPAAADSLDLLQLLDRYTRRAKLPRKNPNPGRIWASRNSTGFAVMLGIVGPLISLALDPCVFKWGDEHGPIFGEYRVFCYSLIGLEIVALTIWLAARDALGPCCGIISGILPVGSAFAGLVGVVLLPLSLLGLLAVIGILGFIPFLTAYVYLKQARAAWESAPSRRGAWAFGLSPLLGVALAIGLPAWAHVGVLRGWEAAVRDVADGDETAIASLQFWSTFLPPTMDDPLDRPIDRESDPVRKRRLIKARDPGRE